MQGYTFVKGEHYPVEHLVFETAPEFVEEFLEVDHEVWTLGEAESDLFDHIPFLYKEVWINENKPGEMHFIFYLGEHGELEKGGRCGHSGCPDRTF